MGSPGDRLSKLWAEHVSAPLPAELYEEPAGIDMVMIDSCIAGCASSAHELGHFAEAGHRQVLESCLEDVRHVLPLLRSADGRAYCERLLALGSAARDVARGHDSGPQDSPLAAKERTRQAQVKASSDLTLPEDRAITEHEAAVVDWVLAHAAFEGPLDRLREGLRRLRVVSRCACGCASVDFARDGQSEGASPVAEALGEDSRGRVCGVIVWELDGRVSGLEVYECEPGSATELPAVGTLRRWESLA